MPRMQPADGARAVRELAERARRVPGVSGREEGARIEVQVVTATHSARFSMPWSEAPVAMLGGIPADMLDGATLILDEARIEARRVGAVQAAMGFHEGGKGR